MVTCRKCGANLLRQTTWACLNCKPLPGDVNADLVEACQAAYHALHNGEGEAAAQKLCSAALAKATAPAAGKNGRET